MYPGEILRRPSHDWPPLLAANRDEMHNCHAEHPTRHWPDRPQVIAGLDRAGGGSWLGINDRALVAAVMDWKDSLGPAPGKRSRGELVPEALDHAEAKAAAGALADLDPDAHNSPFNLVVADARDAYWLQHGGDGEIRVHPIPPGLHMLSATKLDDSGYPRIRDYLPRFRAAQTPEPESGRWEEWRSLLASRTYSPETDPSAAMNFNLLNGFGTVSSALIALPARPGFTARPRWLHADGPPALAPFEPVELRNCLKKGRLSI